jgi:hypothetical protein
MTDGPRRRRAPTAHRRPRTPRAGRVAPRPPRPAGRPRPPPSRRPSPASSSTIQTATPRNATRLAAVSPPSWRAATDTSTAGELVAGRRPLRPLWSELHRRPAELPQPVTVHSSSDVSTSASRRTRLLRPGSRRKRAASPSDSLYGTTTSPHSGRRRTHRSHLEHARPRPPAPAPRPARTCAPPTGAPPHHQLGRHRLGVAMGPHLRPRRPRESARALRR